MIIIFGDNTFGNNLKRWRRKRRMTRIGLALRTGIRLYEICRYEKGIMREVTTEDLTRLCKALDTTAEALANPN